jgi:hypothetical protein
MTIPNDPPVHALWATLRKLWIDREPGVRSNASLARYLSEVFDRPIAPQHVSQWATGTDQRRPPWEVIYLLAHELDYDILLTTEGRAKLVRRVKENNP